MKEKEIKQEKKEKNPPTDEQRKILESEAKRLVISASAGSGKTYIVIEKLKDLICEKKVPVERLLVLTFTKVAAEEVKTRLTNAILSGQPSKKMLESLDELPLSDISTIDSFCEKIIKRNISKLEIEENFTILDEKSSLKLKKMAFSATYQHFSQDEKEMFEEIYLGFKKDKGAFEKCIYSVQDYFGSISDEKEKLQLFINEYSSLMQAACNRLIEYMKDCFKNAKFLLDEMDQSPCSDKELTFADAIYDILGMSFDGDYFDVAQRLAGVKVPSIGSRFSDESKRVFRTVKDYISLAQEIVKEYGYIPNRAREEAKEGKLPKAILFFYKYYIDIYTSLKLKRSGLDFADIEKLAKVLLSDDEVKKGLQDKYDYIFIDEYQDTNHLQESILKPIAEGGYFTAVGDIKQGIYGFRNASMDIMLQDIKDFSSREDGDALYLNGNFRTDDGILSFVNRVFEKIMTLDSVGIDYKEKSMLKGLKKFKPGSMKPVIIDVVLKEDKKKKDKIDDGEKQEKKEERIVYSVEGDVLSGDNSKVAEVDAIISRIETALESEIYDSKLEKYRPVEYNDIAILFRGRSSLMQELVRRLRAMGMPVSASIKEELISDSQIALLNSLLKLTINFKDDISVAAAMSSPFGNFSIDELAAIRFEGGAEKPFWQLVDESNGEKVIEFKKMIAAFKFDIQIFGVIKALCKLFNKYDFYGYLGSLEKSKEKLSNINSLFKMIKSGGLDFNAPGVIAALEGAFEVKSGEGEANSISVLTIHATKGLEYPIVILCGCGDSLTKGYSYNYLLSDNYGMACYLNDFSTMTRIPSPAFLAGKLDLEKREFVDEIMIFYVAMTRAQNHLFIIGSGSKDDYSFENLYRANSYLKYIFFALGENFTEQLFSQGSIVTENVEYNIIERKEEEEREEIKEEVTEKEVENRFKSELEEYDSFVYENLQECKLSYKNSVTGAMNYLKPVEDKDKTEVTDFDETKVRSREEAINTGNAYHEALKLIDFDKVADKESLICQCELLKESMTKGYFDYLDFDLLYKNITLIKDVVGNAKVVKEREFIMQSTPQELGIKREDEIYSSFNLVESENVKVRKNEEDNQEIENTLIVQGIVDLFAMGEKLILIDYKYSSTRDENVLLERYRGQLYLYSLALEKAFNRKVDEKYLLSLKEGKLIKVD